MMSSGVIRSLGARFADGLSAGVSPFPEPMSAGKWRVQPFHCGKRDAPCSHALPHDPDAQSWTLVRAASFAGHFAY
jgi:hypothetical protein